MTLGEKRSFVKLVEDLENRYPECHREIKFAIHNLIQ